NLAAIVELPGWPAKMLADNLPLLIEQFGFRRFQRPGRLASSIRAADIDLKPGCVRHQYKLFASRRLDGIGNVWLFHGGDFSRVPLTPPPLPVIPRWRRLELGSSQVIPTGPR